MNGIFRPGMRGYFIPLTAGVVLAGSAFLPWVIVGAESMIGMPDVAALWVVGLGVLAAVLAVLEHHHATLAVDSTLGQGTTFRATFPALAT